MFCAQCSHVIDSGHQVDDSSSRVPIFPKDTRSTLFHTNIRGQWAGGKKEYWHSIFPLALLSGSDILRLELHCLLPLKHGERELDSLSGNLPPAFRPLYNLTTKAFCKIWLKLSGSSLCPNNRGFSQTLNVIQWTLSDFHIGSIEIGFKFGRWVTGSSFMWGWSDCCGLLQDRYLSSRSFFQSTYVKHWLWKGIKGPTTQPQLDQPPERA